MNRIHGILCFLIWCYCVIAAEVAVCASTPSGEITAKPEVSSPERFDKVWYRTANRRLISLAYEASGTLTVREDSIEFSHEGGTVRIWVKDIARISRGKLSLDAVNDWVIVHLAGSEPGALAAFKGAPFSGGIENRIYSALLRVASGQEEHFAGGFDPREWKIGHQASDQNIRIIEFVRPGEKIDSWTELLTMQVLRKPRTPDAIEVLVPKMHQDISKRCPAMTWNVINRQFASDTEEAGMLYEWAITGCPPDADQHEVARVVYGKFNIFRLAYTAKTPALAPEKREQWIKELSTAKIVRQ